MGEALSGTQAALPIRQQQQQPASDNDNQPTPATTATFGHSLLQQFPFDPAYRNMNNGSFGSIPKVVQAKQREYQDQAEARPDMFIRFTGPKLIDESREAVAKILNAPTDSVVLVSNATTALNVILRNLTWNDDGRDEILYFQTIYGGCGKTVDYMVDTHPGKVSSRAITIPYPAEDDEIIALFREAVTTSSTTAQDKKRPRICIFDSVSSLPGIRFPWEAMTLACKEFGILSLIDGAQGVGMIPIDLTAADPDFFLTNCHKWLHTPRGCAVLYVPPRNQHLMVSTLPTSHGYVPQNTGGSLRPNPLPKSDKPHFVQNFEFSGTIDTAPFFCVKDAVSWRESQFGGEPAVMEYCEDLARAGGKRIAEILGTRVLDNESGTMSRCAMTNVCLPIKITSSTDSNAGEAVEGGQVTIPAADVTKVLQWMQRELPEHYDTFVPTYLFQGELWARVSAQVYLEMDDFVWTAEVLQKLVARVGKGDYKS